MIYQSISLVGPFANCLREVTCTLANLAGLIHLQIPFPGDRNRIPKDARQRREIEPGDGHLRRPARTNRVRAEVGRGDLSDMPAGQGWNADALG